MTESISISQGIADRYAGAVFGLSLEEKTTENLRNDVDALTEALEISQDLRLMITSPVLTREDQEKAVSALAAKMGLSKPMTNVLRLMATKRRLFVLPQLLSDLQKRLADLRGEVQADVTSAAPLSAAQLKELTATLKARVGKEIKIQTAVDESLIGGLVVRLGSKMIDTSIKSQLAALQNAMKEVG